MRPKRGMESSWLCQLTRVNAKQVMKVSTGIAVKSGPVTTLELKGSRVKTSPVITLITMKAAEKVMTTAQKALREWRPQIPPASRPSSRPR